MRRYFFAIVGLALLLRLPNGVFAQASSGNAESEVRDAVEKYRVALMKHDAVALKQIWAGDYTFINGGGQLLTKDQRLANLSSGATSLDIAMAGMKVRIYGDAAVTTGKVTIKGQYSGKESSGDYQSMTVWVKRGSAWQLVANQLTKITDTN
jgi:ketosteroid isomerase-like protein